MGRKKNHHGYKYKNWQLAVMEQGGYKCCKCGSCENLTADHIRPRVSNPELIYDVTNGRILCDKCRVKDMLESWENKKLRPSKRSMKGGEER